MPTLPNDLHPLVFLVYSITMKRRPYWHEPEHLPGQDERDAELERSEFYVYILETDYGDYVGHTWDVPTRVRQHQMGQVDSTRGGNPQPLWSSRPLSTRSEAARFEAAMKSLRDQRARRYWEIVGCEAKPWIGKPMSRKVERSNGISVGTWIWLTFVGATVIGIILTSASMCG